MTVTYSETDDCIINNEKIIKLPDLKGFNTTFDTDSSFLTEDIIKSDSELRSFFNSGRRLEGWQQEPVKDLEKNPIVDLTTGYVESRAELIPCQFYENLNKDLYLVAILIPVFYVIFIVCLIMFYCKYRSVSSQYELLKGETEVAKPTGTDSKYIIYYLKLTLILPLILITFS